METAMAPTFTRKRVDYSEAPVPLAFAFNGSPHQPEYAVTVVGWTATARQVLRDLDGILGKRETRQSLPVVALRGRLEVGVAGNLRLDRRLGIWGQSPTILWAACPPGEARRCVADAVLGWLMDDVPTDTPACSELVQRLRQLHRDDGLVVDTRRTARVFSWEQNRSGTAALSRDNACGYTDLADFVVRQLEGKELLPGLGRLRRIAAGQLDTNQAELVTEPIVNSTTPFSLVVRVRVLSFPGRPTPVVILEISRRIWSRALKRTGVKHLSAYAFPRGSNTALRFTLLRRRARPERVASYCYEPDADFAPIARAYRLPLDMSGDEIAADGHRRTDCPLLVTHKYGVGERVEAKHGVPDLDKMAAFRRAAAILAPLGLLPWEGLVEVLSPTRATSDRDQKWRGRDKDQGHREAFMRWQAEAKEDIVACFPSAHHIVVGYHSSCYRDAKRAESSLLELLGDGVRLQLIPLPSGVHGPRSALPQPTVEKPRNGDHAELRMQAWSPFIAEVRRYQDDAGIPIDGILVIAPEWYGDGHAHDDPVNKRAGRITLAKELRVPVQYLLPEQEDRQKGRRDQDPAERFETRLMMAWLDLAWKNIGRIRTRRLTGVASKIFPGASADGGAKVLPDRVLALGILRRNKTQLANQRSFVPFAIELDVDLGTCSASFAREQGSNFEITSPLPLREAIVELASSGPIRLSTVKEKRTEQLQERSQLFFHKVITDFCRRAERPLVLIDAVACRGVWPWVADGSLDPENVLIARHPHAEMDWGQVRIVRVRTQNAPKVLFDRCFMGECAETGESIRYDAPGWAEAKLFKLTDAHANVYLSFGSLIRSLIRGTSCYREVEGLKQNSGSPRTFSRMTRKPYTGAWSTPDAVELTVVRAAPGESPDDVARFVEWLRTLCQHVGDWTTKPPPLHFEAALKDYLADYDFEEEDEEGSAADIE